MTATEFATWRRALEREYADEQVAAGRWSAEQAPRLAREGNDTLFPQGLTTPGMLFLTALLPGGTPVGSMWIGIEHPRGNPGCAFIYDIHIDEAYRSAGHGRALLTAGEQAARDRGATAIELNVFGANTRAIRLYESAGYTVTTQQMRKPL
ncbi:GNAT family N-acetyltransferase [Actinoplanes sp. NPDC023714]|uniref:GNAT family N-acetyltransferase n=1 Tax=Actinoplanes sp. NPDC023714 TaxID=3154322 RepID=UPI0033C9840B